MPQAFLRFFCLALFIFGGWNLAAGENPKPAGAGGNPGIQSAGRHGDYSKKAAQGPHLKLISATYFGSEGCEEFVACSGLPDGTVVAFGNAWGPQFPAQPAPTVLGTGRHQGQTALATNAKGQAELARGSPDMAGFMVFYSGNLSEIKRVIRFDWGTANLMAGLVTGDGQGLIACGRCQAAFASLAALFPQKQLIPPAAAPDPAGKARGKAPGPACDVYVARFSLAGQPEWVCVLMKNGDPPDGIFTDEAGAIYFDAQGLRRVSPDGRQVTLFSKRTGGGTGRWLGVDPKDGTAYFGGDRNTNTGREPYRQPYFYKINAKEEKVYTLYEPPPKEVGANGCNLQSDSSVRVMAFAKNGDLLLGGWSDGGNSVFPRQATDYRKPASGGGLGFQTFGMKSANSLGHLMRLDPATQETKSHTWWAAFVPSWFNDTKFRNAPNAVWIKQLKVLSEGSVAFSGGAATGLIQTPGAFWTDPMTGEKHGGEYAAVLNPDLNHIYFSSYLPGCAQSALGATERGVLIASYSVGSDKDAQHPTPSPVFQAFQKEFKGGTDAHLILLELPASR